MKRESQWDLKAGVETKGKYKLPENVQTEMCRLAVLEARSPTLQCLRGHASFEICGREPFLACS